MTDEGLQLMHALHQTTNTCSTGLTAARLGQQYCCALPTQASTTGLQSHVCGTVCDVPMLVSKKAPECLTCCLGNCSSSSASACIQSLNQVPCMWRLCPLQFE